MIDRLRRRLPLPAAYGALILVMYLSGIGCLFRFLFGISCPGCGMTRACLALLRLDFTAALRYHPLCPLVPPLALALLFAPAPKNPKRLLPAVLALCALCLIVWLIRLACGDPITAFDLSKGLLTRFFVS